MSNKLHTAEKVFWNLQMVVNTGRVHYIYRRLELSKSHTKLCQASYSYWAELEISVTSPEVLVQP